jgi:hypothetical protein
LQHGILYTGVGGIKRFSFHLGNLVPLEAGGGKKKAGWNKKTTEQQQNQDYC